MPKTFGVLDFSLRVLPTVDLGLVANTAYCNKVYVAPISYLDRRDIPHGVCDGQKEVLRVRHLWNLDMNCRADET